MTITCPLSLAYSLAKTNVRILDTLIVNGEEGQAQQLLLIDFFDGLHGLLVAHRTGPVLTHVHSPDIGILVCSEGWVCLLEPGELLLGEHLPDGHPLGVVRQTLFCQFVLACLRLRWQAVAFG